MVRDHARLTTRVVEPSLDRATISESAFDWLCALAGRFNATGARLLQVDDARWLRLDSHVGVIETPCGTIIEILPKHDLGVDAQARSRSLLRRMIRVALDLPMRDVGAADIAVFESPLSEWVIRQFLEALDHLVKRGLRFDYRRLEEEQRFLRGQLDVGAQSRQPPSRRHYFQIRHDVFVPDRAENRLLRSALDVACASAQEPGNWRLAHALRGLMNAVPSSVDVRGDFASWSTDRLLAHYKPIRPWCEITLKRFMPFAVADEWHGVSMLFPMEKLFERFVQASLQRCLPPGATLANQSRGSFLCEHEGRGFFQLRPDFLLTHGDRRWVLDAKWKRLDESDRVGRYGLSQGDFYQLFAYGSKALPSGQVERELVLVYPASATFKAALPVFSFDDNMTMWVLPFDMGEKEGSERLELPEAMALTHVLRSQA